jgi:hypothetical protein
MQSHADSSRRDDHDAVTERTKRNAGLDESGEGRDLGEVRRLRV